MPQKFTVGGHNVILDAIFESIEKRFQYIELYLDKAFLSPSNFKSITSGNIPEDSLENLGKKISFIDKNTTKENLKDDLIPFASAWDRLKISIVDEYSVIIFKGESDDDLLTLQLPTLK